MNEMEQYKIKVKEKIQALINEGNINEAENLILQYEDTVKDDVDIFSMKAIILIMQNELGEAEIILKEAFKIDRSNSDILFNLGYIYEFRRQYSKAYSYYLDARAKSNSDEFIANIDKILANLKENCDIDMKDFNYINKKTSIVILTYNNLDYTKLCIESIRRYTEEGTYEIIVVDNNSTDETVGWLKNQVDLKLVLNEENMGFPKGCNQGIKISDKDNDILLLNNDTIVTPRWLENLKICLYSDEKVGAVGAITNSCSYYQSIPVNYNTIEEMLEYAELHNISDSSKWEQRVKLVGFCMLIERKVLNETGLLDERFSPGNFEDDDLSFRIGKLGYKLFLCKDTFIHHFGSVSFKTNPEGYNKVLHVNSKKFEEKWGFNSTYSCFIRNEIIELIDGPKDKKINVLEIGCATGATLLKIKDIYRNANIYGIELNENSAQIAKVFADVRAENIENIYLSYEEEFFDYIIFADVLEHLYDPWKALENIRKYLKPEGKLLASIPNIMHYTILKGLLNGNWSYQDAGILDRTHIRFFTLNEIDKMFKESGYTNMKYSATISGGNEDDQKFISNLCSLTGNNSEEQYKVYQYIVKSNKSKTCKDKEVIEHKEQNTSGLVAADKNRNDCNGINEVENIIISEDEYNHFKHIIRRIENNIDFHNSLNYLLDSIISRKISKEHIADIIFNDMIKKEDLLNAISVLVYLKERYDISLYLLELAYKLNPNNQETIYNMSYIIYKLGDKDTALSFLNSINTDNEKIIKLKNEILGDK